MVAISFHKEFLDALLRCDKQQTTRQTPKDPKVPRIKVGDIAQIYIKQRQSIVTKPVRQMTSAGFTAMADRADDINYHYPANCPVVEYHRGDLPSYYAHFIGILEITEVYKIIPGDMSDEELEAWAWADGFKDFAHADMWFFRQHGGRWMELPWMVSRWIGWSERYFEPMEVKYARNNG